MGPWCDFSTVHQCSWLVKGCHSWFSSLFKACKTSAQANSTSIFPKVISKWKGHFLWNRLVQPLLLSAVLHEDAPATNPFCRTPNPFCRTTSSHSPSAQTVGYVGRFQELRQPRQPVISQDFTFHLLFSNSVPPPKDSCCCLYLQVEDHLHKSPLNQSFSFVYVHRFNRSFYVTQDDDVVLLSALAFKSINKSTIQR